MTSTYSTHLDLMSAPRYVKNTSIVLSFNRDTHTKVRTCIDSVDESTKVMKIFSKTMLGKRKRYINTAEGMVSVSEWDDVAREYDILKQLHHPHVLGLLDVIETDTKLKLVFQYHQGSIMTHSSHGFYKTNITDIHCDGIIHKVMAQIGSAIKYIHSLGIAHRDIKPENILVTHEADFVLADFGYARRFTGLSRESPGTLAFYAPEICRQPDEPHDPRKADIWAQGLVAWCCKFSKLPYDLSDSTFSVLQQISSWDVARDSGVDKFSDPLKTSIKTLLATDPSSRDYLPDS